MVRACRQRRVHAGYGVHLHVSGGVETAERGLLAAADCLISESGFDDGIVVLDEEEPAAETEQKGSAFADVFGRPLESGGGVSGLQERDSSPITNILISAWSTGSRRSQASLNPPSRMQCQRMSAMRKDEV
jgi:hypothetical protein